MSKAARMGAAAGNSQYVDIWSLSKRELIEVGLHLAALATGHYDDAIQSNEAADRLREEVRALRSGGLI